MRCVNHEMQYRSGFNTLLGMDARNRQTSTYSFDDQPAMQEPRFISNGASAKEPEGYLIGVVNPHDEMRSRLFVLDP
jgi:carotenoid cleavage dioxygenase-like enzyme